MSFAQFMSSSAGRALRVVAGIALILVGLLAMEGTWGIVVAIVGLVPLVAGVFDFCLIGALFGAPLHGKDVRGQ
ncbi:MAG: DUF2892 domain-containing protein [Anaerolineales bacterium]|jgi:hypothetical protein